MRTLSEEEILYGINTRDHEAFRQLFKMYYAPLRYFAKQLIGKDLRDDFIEIVFLKLRLRNRPFESFKIVQAFLYGSVLKSCQKLVRRNPTKFNLLTGKRIKQNAGRYLVETECLRLTALQMEKA